MSLNGKWVNYGQEYRNATFARFDDVCVLSGLMKTSVDDDNHVATIPPDCRLTGHLIFGLNQQGTTRRFDLDVDGTINWSETRTICNCQLYAFLVMGASSLRCKMEPAITVLMWI